MSTAEERARARATWPSRKTTLADQAEAVAELTGQEAWDAVMELTFEAWSLKGGIPPRLPRSPWPSKLFRPGDKRPDSNGL